MNAIPKTTLAAPALLVAAPVLDAAGVAALLGLSRGHFFNRRRALEAAGFPCRLPGLAGWSRACVMRWIETNGETFMPVATDGAAGNPLEERYARP